MDLSLQILFRRYLEGTLSLDEAAALERWLEEAGSHRQILEELKDPAQIAETFAAMDIVDVDAAWEKLNARRMNNSNRVPRVHRVHFLRTAWFRYAAAVLIILTALFVYREFSRTSQPGKEVAIDQPSPQPDILPGSNKAILTLSDGRKVDLNSATSETIKDEELSIANNNGQLIYSDAERGSLSPAGGSTPRGARREGGPASYNTMSTPRGGQYQLILPDGSKVWLNAESSITFPTAFTGKTREIKMSGEAYFEIKPNATKPFIAKTLSAGSNTGRHEITVLGTSFNVKEYSNEDAKISLAEGIIKVSSDVRNDETILQPGYAFIGGKSIKTDLGQDLAWKNGVFNFDNMNIDAVFKQLSRWYNVDIKYQGKVPVVEPSGEMGRDLTLSQVLRALKNIGIRTRIEGNTVIILP